MAIHVKTVRVLKKREFRGLWAIIPSKRENQAHDTLAHREEGKIAQLSRLHRSK